MSQRSATARAWPDFAVHDYVAWAVIALAYTAAFLQRVSPQTVNASLIQDFATNAAGAGVLASGYFWGYTLMQVPAGLLVDRFGVKNVVLCSLTASAFGSAGFALSQTIPEAFAARLIIACGDALVFTSLLKLVALRFPDHRFGLMSGLSQVSGYVGGALATAPLAAAVAGFGWRDCFLFLAAIGAVNLLATASILPAETPAQLRKSFRALLQAAGRSLTHAAGWGCALTFGSHFAVVTTLSGIWGLPMIAGTFGVSPTQAGMPLLAFMIGNAAGSIVLGHVADKVRSLDRALIRICIARMALIAMVLPAAARPFGLGYAVFVFAVLGLVAGGTVPLVLKCTKRIYTAELIGVGASVNTTTAGVIAAVMQPVIGVAMVASSGIPHQPQQTGHDLGAIGDTGYSVMIAILLCISLVGILGPMMMRRSLRQA